MNSQRNLSDSYQEQLQSLTLLHPDLDQKLIQSQFKDDVDILKAVFIKVKLKALKQSETSLDELKPLDLLSKNDLLQAKLSYLIYLKAQQMEEQGTSEANFNTLLKLTLENVERYQKFPKKLAAEQLTLKELQYIRGVTCAIQQTKNDIRNQLSTQQNDEEININIGMLMKEWNEKHDPITDIEQELQCINESIERYKHQLKQEEEKLALILQIVEAKQPLLHPKNIFFDQEEKKESTSLIDEQGPENGQSPKEDITQSQTRRLTVASSQNLHQENGSAIQQLQSESNRDEIGNFQSELNKLCEEEEIKNKFEAENELSFLEISIAEISNKNLRRYKREAQRMNQMKLIIELFNKIDRENVIIESIPTIDYSNAHKIPEINPSDSKKESALERARNAMLLNKEMPACFQMTMNKVLYFSTLLLYQQRDDIFGLSEIQMREQLEINLRSLINQFNQEEFESQEVRKLILEVQEKGNTQNELETIIKNIYSAQIKHRFFNFREFSDLLSINERSSEQLKGKEIILLLGTTGCGKSTTMHYLSGSKMERTEKEGLIHIQASLAINRDLIKVKCSPLQKSETRYVTPIEINLAQIGFRQDQIVTLVDTPGSQDTESYEVDISNSLGIIRAVRQTKGVRLAILLSYLKFGARGEEIKKLIAYYSGLLTNIDKYVNAFSFFFTHVPKEISMNDLRGILKECFNQLTEQDKKNQNLVILFQHIVDKAQDAVDEKSKQVHILRPLDRNPIIIHQSILQSTLIEDSSSFVERIEEKAKIKVLQQFKIHAKAIISAIKRNDGKYALFLIQDLLSFQKLFPFDYQFKKIIKEIVEEFIQFGQQLFNLGMQSLNKAFEVQEDNNLILDDFQQFKQSFIQAKSAIDPFYQIIPTEFTDLQTKILVNDPFLSNQYIHHLSKLLEKSVQNPLFTSKELANPLWNRYAKKFLLTKEFFSESKIFDDEKLFMQQLNDNIVNQFERVFKKGVDEITNKTREIIFQMTINDFITIKDNEKLKENLNQIIEALNQAEVNFLKEGLNSSIKKIFDYIQSRCQSIRDSEQIEFIDLLNYESQKNVSQKENQEGYIIFDVTPKHVQSISNFIKMHLNLSSYLELICGTHSQQFLKELETQTIEIKENLLKLYSLYQEMLISEIEKNGVQHHNIKKIYSQIQSLKREPFVEERTQNKYNDFINYLLDLVDEQKEKVKQSIPDIDQVLKIKIDKIVSHLDKLKEEWRTFIEFKNILPQSNEFQLIVNDLSNYLLTRANEYKQEAQQKQLNFNNINQIEQLYVIYTFLNYIGQLTIISNIEITDIKQEIQGLLNQIEELMINIDEENNQSIGMRNYDEFLINKKQCQKIESMLLFLKINSSSQLIKDLDLMEQSQKLYTNFKQFILKNSDLQLQSLKLNIDSIQQKFGLPDKNNIIIIETEVRNSVKNIVDRLKTFKEISSHQELKQVFQIDMDSEQDNLKEFLQVLKDKMINLHALNRVQLNKIIVILSNLFELDTFIVSEPNLSFNKIHSQAFEILKQKYDKIDKDAEIALQERLYKLFNEILQNEDEIEKVGKPSLFKSIKNKLQEHIKILIDSFSKTMHENKLDDQKINEGLMKIIEILLEVKEEYIEIQIREKLESTFDKYFNYLNNNSKKTQDQSSKLIKDRKYFEAYKIVKDSLKMLNQINLKNEQQQQTLNSLLKKIISIKEQLIRHFQLLQQQISQEAKTLEALSHPNDFIQMNVPLMCFNLEQIIEAKDLDLDVQQQYDSILKSINNTYIKTTTLIQEAVKIEDQINLCLDRKIEITIIKNSLSSFNEKIKFEVLPTIEKVEREINIKIDPISKILQAILSSMVDEKNIFNLDFKKLSNQLINRELNLDQDFKDQIDEQCLRVIDLVENKLEMGPLCEVFEKCLGKFFDIQTIYIQPHLKIQTKQRIQALQQNVQEIFRELQNILNSQFSQFNITIKTDTQIERKSPYLAKDQFIQTFQSFIEIPNEFQSQIIPQFQEQVVSITKIGFQSLNDIKGQFDDCINQNQFSEAIEILKLHDHFDIELLCFQDESYVKFCYQLNDPQINHYVEYFKQYNVKKFYYERLKNSFQNQFSIAEQGLVQIQNLQNSNLFDFKKFKTSIKAIEIFDKHHQLFQQFIQKDQIQSVIEELKKIIDKKIQLLSVQQFETCLKNPFNQDDFDSLKIEVETIRNMREHFYQQSLKFKEILKQIRQQTYSTCTLIKKQIEKEPILNQIPDFLIKLQAIIEIFSDQIKEKDLMTQYQDVIVLQLQNKNYLKPEFFFTLLDALNKSKYGLKVLEKNIALQKFQILQKMSSLTDPELEELLQKTQGYVIEVDSLKQQNTVDIKSIFKQYRAFEFYLNFYLKSVYEKHSTVQSLVETQISDRKNINMIYQFFPQLIALLFCIHSLKQLGEEQSQFKDFQDFKNSLLQPQPQWIIALVKMFEKNCSDKQNKHLLNNIIDLQLNEENGIVISIASSIFALQGFQVSCACANEFICKREYFKYQKLFQILKISQLIEYKTLTDICQSYIKSSEGTQVHTDISTVEAYRQKLQKNELQKQSLKIPPKKMPKIMLLYNLENLFSIQFQQEVFPLLIEFQNQQIIDSLIRQLDHNYEKNQLNNSFNSNLESNKFSGFNIRYQNLLELVIQQEKKDYQLYRNNDSEFNTQLSNYYSTSKSKFFQSNFKQFSSSHPSNNLKLVLTIGKFLLREIPQHFTYIMGLTSNFAIKDQIKREIMYKYKILDFTLIPPIKNTFQSLETSEFIYQKDQILKTNSEQFQEIQITIQKLIEQENPSILVVFNSLKTIYRFKNQIKDKGVEYQIVCLTQDGEVKIKGLDLLKAGELKAQVNLITRKDIIGIDFKIVNSQVNQQLGLYVIQTFPSNSQTEDLNIKLLASTYFKIISKEKLDRQQRKIEQMEKLRISDSLGIQNDHKQSMEQRKQVFEQQGNNIDSDIEKFLIYINKLPNPKLINQEDGLSITIMLDFTTPIKELVFDKICQKINEIFIQQRDHNHLFNFPQFQELLRFNIYLLGTNFKDYHFCQARNEQHLKEVTKMKEKHNLTQKNLTNSLATALKNCNVQKQNFDHIILIGTQDLDIKKLQQIQQEFPPIHSYYISEEQKSENQYRNLIEIQKNGKISGPIAYNQVGYMLDVIEYYIFDAFYSKYKEKMNKIDELKYTQWLTNKKPFIQE